MRELRCKNCNRFLAKMNFGEIEIKCSNGKCKTMNKFRIVSAKFLTVLTAEEEKAILTV